MSEAPGTGRYSPNPSLGAKGVKTRTENYEERQKTMMSFFAFRSIYSRPHSRAPHPDCTHPRLGYWLPKTHRFTQTGS